MKKEKLRRVIDNKGTREEVHEMVDWLRTDDGQECISALMDEDFDSLRKGRTGEWAECDAPVTEMQKRLLDEIREQKRNRWKRMFIAAAVALPLILAVGGLWLVSDRTGLLDPVSYTEVLVPAGDKIKVLLPDGSDVTLNALSKMRYPSHFGIFSREVELDGEAYFSVSADKSRPFSVHTGALDVTVLGTKFNVKAYGGEPVRVHLDEGSVLLEDHGSLRRVLKPGENAEYDRGTGNCQISATFDRDAASAWTRNRQCFNRAPLSEVINTIARLYGVEFNAGDLTILSERFTISFSNKCSINEVLTDIETVSRVRFHKVSEKEWEIYRE